MNIELTLFDMGVISEIIDNVPLQEQEQLEDALDEDAFQYVEGPYPDYNDLMGDYPWMGITTRPERRINPKKHFSCGGYYQQFNLIFSLIYNQKQILCQI